MTFGESSLFKCYHGGIYWLSPREQEEVKRQIYILEHKRVRGEWTMKRLDQSLDRVSLLLPFSFVHFTIWPSRLNCVHWPLSSRASSLVALPLPLDKSILSRQNYPLSFYKTTKLVSPWNQLQSIASTLPWFLPNSLSHSFEPPLCTLLPGAIHCLVQQRSQIHLKHLFIA